jgi:hypothetical protein
VHDPGKILTDLAMALALGGDCLADVAVLRAQPQSPGRGVCAVEQILERPREAG